MSDLNSSFDEIKESVSILGEKLSSLTSYLSKLTGQSGEGFNFAAEIPSKGGSTNEIVGKIGSMVALVQKFPAGASVEFVPRIFVDDFRSSLSILLETVSNIVSTMDSMIAPNGGIGKIDCVNFQFMAVNGSVQQFARIFQRLFDATEKTIIDYLRLSQILRPLRGALNFQAVTNSLRLLIDQISEELADARVEKKNLFDYLKKVEQLDASANANQEKANAASVEAERHRDESKADRQKISEYLADSTTSRDEIKAIMAVAAELKKSVENYKPKFDAFDSALEQRETDHDESMDKVSKLEVRLDAQEKHIKMLVNQAESMLKGATNSGLASHYDILRKEITRELGSARRAFFGGIFFLTLSMLPAVSANRVGARA